MSRGPYVASVYIGHDASVAIVGDGKIVHLEAERFSRVKHDHLDMERAQELMAHACALAGVDPEEIAVLAGVGCSPYLGDARTRRAWTRDISQADDAGPGQFLGGRDIRTYYVAHHLSHAAYAFYTSPFEVAQVLAIDGGGDAYLVPGTDHTAVIDAAVGQAQHLVGTSAGCWELDVVDPPSGLGGWWNIESERLYGSIHAAGTVMALTGIPEKSFVEETGWTPTDYAEVTRLQAATTAGLTQLVAGGMPQLCLAGGVALNGIAVDALIRSGRCVHVPPAVYDGGCSVGAALYVLHVVLGVPRCAYDWQTSAFAGWTEPELEGAPPIDRIADALAEGEVVALVHGKAESGPRALGHRSILADPRAVSMRHRLNAIKGRQPWRPTAPVTTRSEVHRWFHLRDPAAHRFMTVIAAAQVQLRERAPAAVHADGSARVQVTDDHTVLGQIVTAFGARTGVPILLNTSFNLKGEAMANDPEQARDSFRRSQAGTPIDHLVIGDRWERA